MLVGGSGTFSLLGMMTIGIFVLPIPVCCHGPARVTPQGWPPRAWFGCGDSAPALYFSLLNHDGPGSRALAVSSPAGRRGGQARRGVPSVMGEFAEGQPSLDQVTVVARYAAPANVDTSVAEFAVHASVTPSCARPCPSTLSIQKLSPAT